MKNFNKGVIKMHKIYICFIVIMVVAGSQLMGQNLAEALGYNKDARVVIINADDYGMCHAENLGTHKVLEYGIVSSATLMVPCPWIDESIRYIHKNKLKNIGIHVTLTSEWQKYRWRPISGKQATLVDKDGYMWRESIQVEQNAKIEEIEEEVRAQLDYALERGLDLSHFDSHMGSFYGIYTNRVELLALALSLSYEYGLPFRIPHFDMTHPFREMGFAIIDHLERSFNAPKNLEKRREYYINFFKNLPPGVTEVYIHPAIANTELKNVTNSHATRQADVSIFTDPEIKKAITDSNIHVIDFRVLREWQRKKMKWQKGLKSKDVFVKYVAILKEHAKTSPYWKQATGQNK